MSENLKSIAASALTSLEEIDALLRDGHPDAIGTARLILHKLVDESDAGHLRVLMTGPIALAQQTLNDDPDQEQNDAG